MPLTCTACGSASRSGARFCMHCTAPLPMACGECGTDVPTGARFCSQCGAALQVSGPDPRSYTPKHLADKILQSKSALAGERKAVWNSYPPLLNGRVDEAAAGIAPERIERHRRRGVRLPHSHGELPDDPDFVHE